MDDELTFSLSYELLTRKAEEEIRKCSLDKNGTGYLQALAKASAILSFWHKLALNGYTNMADYVRLEADWQRLEAIIERREGVLS